ncbi:MAG: hypothetical protein Q9178_006068 [Gyalolechia marmorata]
MDTTKSSQPIPDQRLEEIATNNTTLKNLIAETSTDGRGPEYKFAVTSTVIQHTTPPQPTSDDTLRLDGADQQNSSIGRRGMHSASGAYWNNEKDGMWNWKYIQGEKKGFDVILSIIWISIT